MDSSTRLVSGFGQNHSIKNGRHYLPITLPEIRRMVDNPPSVDKALAQWLIPSSLPSRVFAEQEAHGQFHLLWADLDRNAPPLDAVQQFLNSILSGADWEVYNSRSATQENPKSRILIPCSKPLLGADWINAQTVLTDLLRVGADRKLTQCAD